MVTLKIKDIFCILIGLILLFFDGFWFYQLYNNQLTKENCDNDLITIISICSIAISLIVICGIIIGIIAVYWDEEIKINFKLNKYK